MRILKKKILVAGATALLSTSAFAGDINWSGFLSVVGGQTLDSDIQPVDPDGPGPATASPTELQTYDAGFFGYGGGVYGPDTTFEQESVVAIQGQSLITDKLRATVQLLARGGNDWDLEAEWAYFTYSLNDEWSINAGRIRFPLYYFSDFLDVGYAYDWVRPPAELYAGPSAINGVSANYSSYWGNVEVNAQVYTGSSNYDFGAFGTVSTRNIIGTAINFTIGNLSIRPAYSDLDVTFQDLGGLELAFEQMGLAFIYDVGNFKFRAEWAQSVLGDFDEQDKYYGSIAYSFGDFTPYYSFTSDGEAFFPPTPEAEVNAIGVAWDFHSNARLKFEYLVEEKIPSGYEVEVVTAAIDIVF